MRDTLSCLSHGYSRVVTMTFALLMAPLLVTASPAMAERSPAMPDRLHSNSVTAPAGVQMDSALNPTSTSKIRTANVWLARPRRPDYMNLQEKPLIRWHDRKRYILVYIPLAEEMPGWRPEIPARLVAAFGEWEEALAENGEKRLEFLFVRDPKTYDVKVIWDGKAIKTPEGDQVGENMTDTWNGYMRTNNLRLAINDSDGKPFDPDLFESNALHEIGHMLGIKNHSDDPNDVMAAVSGPGAHHLTDRDIATVRALYRQPADCANPVNIALSRFSEFQKKELRRSQQWTWVAVPNQHNWGY